MRGAKTNVCFGPIATLERDKKRRDRYLRFSAFALFPTGSVRIDPGTHLDRRPIHVGRDLCPCTLPSTTLDMIVCLFSDPDLAQGQTMTSLRERWPPIKPLMSACGTPKMLQNPTPANRRGGVLRRYEGFVERSSMSSVTDLEMVCCVGHHTIVNVRFGS